MLDLHGKNLSPLSPIIKMHVRRSSTGDRELDIYESFSDQFSFSTELELQGTGLGEEGFGVFSPRLWKSNRPRSIRTESYPLLPQNHHYSNLSPNSRRRIIVDGRRELMKMVETMPESSYELSLKDIVDEQRSSGEEDDEKKGEDGSFVSHSESQIRKMRKNKNNRTIQKGHKTRTASMERETFLIKMFFPTSLGSKKKTKSGKNSRVSSLKSPEQSENDIEKDWSMKGFFITKRSSSGSSSSSSNDSRCVSERNSVPGCWSFLPNMQSKSTRERGCIF